MQLEDHNRKSVVLYCIRWGKLGSLVTKYQSIPSLFKSTMHCNIDCKVGTFVHVMVQLSAFNLPCANKTSKNVLTGCKVSFKVGSYFLFAFSGEIMDLGKKIFRSL